MPDALARPLLLHVPQSAARVTIVDMRWLLLALVAFGIASIAIWIPHLARLPDIILRRAPRRRILRLVATSMMFLALLPAVLPFDHLFMPDTHVDAAIQDAVHEAHCHIAPGSCSDAPIPAGPGQLLLFQPLVVVPILLTVLLSLAIPMLAGIVVTPDRRPPLRSAVSV